MINWTVNLLNFHDLTPYQVVVVKEKWLRHSDGWVYEWA